MPHNNRPAVAGIRNRRPTKRALAAAAFGLMAALGAAVAPAGDARAQTVFGTNTGTFADYLFSYGMEAVPLRDFGTAASPFSPATSVHGNNGSLVADFGTVTYAYNYPIGTYTLQFDSPSPVTVNLAGFWNTTNVTRSGTHTTQTIQLTHDGKTVTDGMGWLTASGVSSSNPVTNFSISKQGTNPSNLTSTFQSLTGKYGGTRYMNNVNINNNTNLMTSASLVPTGYNAGQNSYADIVKWTNTQSSQKVAMINIPVNADSTFIAQVAKTMSGLASGKQLVVEYGNEDWNYGFSQAGWLANLANSDSRVTATDGFGKGAQETGLKAAAMMQTFKANYTGAASLSGFLGSQGANQYFVQQEKQAIKNVYGASTLSSLFKYQGISVYPGDNITSATDKTNLYNQLESDLARQIGYLKNDVADATKDGLKELVYEWSPNGYLTHGGVSQAIIDAFRADPMSKQLTLDTWAAINNNIGTGGMAFDFDVVGDGWSTQISPLAAPEYEQQAINQISASLGVGSAPLAPEPTSLGLVVFAGSALLARRRRAA